VDPAASAALALQQQQQQLLQSQQQQQAMGAMTNMVMMQTMQKSARVGSNGGTAAGLVGSYEEVATRIKAFHAAGIELFMLQFQPFEAEMERFAREVIPRVREWAPVATAGAPAHAVAR
jgi:alkanesulfonate monooxygenase